MHCGRPRPNAVDAIAIGAQRMPLELIHALAQIEWAAAEVNLELGLPDEDKAHAIATSAARVSAGGFDEAFALSV
jgi:fumarate hydratase, class II